MENNELYGFFSDLFENPNKKQWNPFHEKINQLFDAEAHKLSYQEQCTKISLLMVMVADDRMAECIQNFVETSTENLSQRIDEQRIKELYEEISYMVGNR